MGRKRLQLLSMAEGLVFGYSAAEVVFVYSKSDRAQASAISTMTGPGTNRSSILLEISLKGPGWLGSLVWDVSSYVLAHATVQRHSGQCWNAINNITFVFLQRMIGKTVIG